jgi:protein gp37
MSTKISWATESWNPFVGCSLVSPACTNCYAMHQAARMLRMRRGQIRTKPEIPGNPYDGVVTAAKHGPVWTGVLNQATEATRFQPLKWGRPRTVFVGSMTDFFHPAAGDAWRIEALAIMALTPRHTYLILTKRSADMRRLMADPATQKAVWTKASEISIQRNIKPAQLESVSPGRWPLPNVALGVSAEDQTRADERIAYLLDTPAAQRFVSCEPLLEAIDLTFLQQPNDGFGHWWVDALNMERAGWFHDAASTIPMDDSQARGDLAALDFVIAGGGNDLDGRPTHPDWLRSLRDQCWAAGVKFHFKQWGAWAPIPALLPAERDAFWELEARVAPAADDPNCRTRLLDKQGRIYRYSQKAEAAQAGAIMMLRIGTARSGRTLDGREHLDILGGTQ